MPRNKRKKNGRQHDKALEKRSASAQASGIARTPATTSSVATCPLRNASSTVVSLLPSHTHYEFCSLTSLIVEVRGKDGGGSATLSRQRRKDTPARSADFYKGDLAVVDLVMEALSTAPDDKMTMSGHAVAEPERVPLRVKAQGAASPVHSTFSPPHPASVISGSLLNKRVEGGGPVEGDLALNRLSVLSPGTWGRLWPFGSAAGESHDLIATACGNLPSGGISELAVRVYVMPHEEWKVSLGLGKARGGGYEAEKNFAEADDDHGVAVKVTRTHESGISSRETELSTYEDGFQKKALSSARGVGITVTSEAEQEKKAGKRKFKTTEKSKGHGVGKVAVEWKVAGQECEFEAADFIEDMEKIAEVIQDVSKLMDSVKVGWAIKFSYSLFEGDLFFTWGHRWPKNYHETSRVYYIEQFLGVGGQCTLLAGEVEGMFGVDINPWWLPASLILKAFLKLEVELGVGGSVQRNWTNATPPKPTLTRNGRDLLFKLDGEASITPELGLKGGATLFGVGAIITAQIEGKQELTLDAGVSLRQGPEASTTLESSPVEGVFSIELPFLSRTYEKRVELISGFDGWKDRPLF